MSGARVMGEPEDCPICKGVKTMHMGAVWHGKDGVGGWHGIGICTACRHWVAPMRADTWWERLVLPGATKEDDDGGSDDS